MRLRFRWTLVAMALAITLWAADEPFTLEQVLSAPFPSDVVASPQGSRIAWVFNAQGRRNIWVAEGPGFAARQLTRYAADDGQEIGELQFSPSGDAIVFVRGGNKNAAGEVPNPTSDPEGSEQAVWAIAWTGGAARKIDLGDSPAVATAGNRVAYVRDNQIWLAPLAGPGKPQQIVARGQNSSPVWSPDGGKLAFVSNRGTHSWIGVYDPAKKRVNYLSPSVDRDTFPRWSLDSRSIAFVRRPAQPVRESPGSLLTTLDEPNPWAIWIVDIASGRGRELWRSTETPEGSFPNMAGNAVLNWATDRIVFVSEQDGWQHLYSIPATGGAPLLLTPGECEFEQLNLTPDRRVVIYSSNCGDIDRRHLWRVAVTGGASQQLTSGQGIEWGAVPTADNKWIAYLASDARRPAMPFVRAVGAQGAGQMLASQAAPKDFPSAQLVVPQQVVFQAADKTPIHGQLFLPGESKTSTRYPTVVFMHGGPVRQMLLGWHNREYYHNAYALNQYLASRGYIVLSVNFRSGIGYGRGFREAKGRGVRGASEYQDIVAAARYLASRPDVDRKRIGLWGGSYGGYLTALGLARDSDLFAAGVDLHGVHDWSRRNWMGDADAERVRLARESSPVAAVDKWRSPVLLIHGDDDRNVNFDQTVDLVARLRKQKVEVQQLVFPDDVHDFLLHRNWLAAYRAAADFFDRYLKPAGERADSRGR